MLVEMNIFVCYKCIEDMGFCVELIDCMLMLHVGIVIICSIYCYFHVSFFLVSCFERMLSCCNVCRRWNVVGSHVSVCW